MVTGLTWTGTLVSSPLLSAACFVCEITAMPRRTPREVHAMYLASYPMPTSRDVRYAACEDLAFSLMLILVSLFLFE